MAKVKKPLVTEADLQSAVRAYLEKKWPGVPFTAFSAVQFTNVVARVQAKKMGSNSSYPDLCIFRARGGYHGLMIEFKAPDKVLYKKDGTLRKDEHFEKQLARHEQLRAEGYAVHVVQEFAVAVRIIEDYLAQR